MKSHLRKGSRPIHRSTLELRLGGEVAHRLEPSPTTIGPKHPRKEIVLPGDLKSLDEVVLQGLDFDGNQHLDATVEVSLHQVR